MKNDSKLLNEIIDLELINIMEETNIYLEYLYTKINFYEQLIAELSSTKHSKFISKKQNKNKKKIETYTNEIINSYKRIEEEYKILSEINDHLKTSD